MNTQNQLTKTDGSAGSLALDHRSALEGAIYASCGHKLADDEGEHGCGFDTITLGDDCDFDGVYRCSFFGSACRKCYDEMAARNMLATREEADRWIKTGELPERMKCEKPNVEMSHAHPNCPAVPGVGAG